MENTNVIESSAVPANQLNLGGLLQIPAVRQVTLLVGVAFAVAAGFAIVLWSQSPGYTHFAGNISSTEAAEIADALRVADIDYKINESDGSVMVAGSRLHDARLLLASQGLPVDATAGMDQMQEQSSFGVSQFMESARYQHALEAELARTISSVGAVREARVHLALPKQTAFVRDRKSASASVLLQLYRGRSLEPDQATSIVHLVASSVPNLGTANVTLIDQHGRMLSSVNEQESATRAATRFKLSRQLEEKYKRRIEDLLTPLVGAGRIRAEVVADLDFTETEETRESFDPARTVVRSEQVSEDKRQGNGALAQGVPGALSNQPPEAAAAATDPTAEGTAAPAEPVNTSRSSLRNFEVDRTISRVRPSAGTIRKLSVAVLVDDSAPAADESADGAATPAALTADDVARFTALVKEAVGFNEARGDSVAVINAAFLPIAPAEEAEPPAFWEKPWLQDAMKQILGALLVLAIAFGVVRPMLRGVLASNSAISGEYLGNASGFAMPLAAGQAGAAQSVIPPPNFDEKVAAAKNITGHDPARVAQVVKKWVSADE